MKKVRNINYYLIALDHPNRRTLVGPLLEFSLDKTATPNRRLQNMSGSVGWLYAEVRGFFCLFFVTVIYMRVCVCWCESKKGKIYG
jgi:hypothetical protein